MITFLGLGSTQRALMLRQIASFDRHAIMTSKKLLRGVSSFQRGAGRLISNCGRLAFSILSLARSSLRFARCH